MTFSAECHRRRRWAAPTKKSGGKGCRRQGYTGWERNSSKWTALPVEGERRLGDQAEALGLVDQHAGVDGGGPGESGMGQHDAGDGARRGDHDNQRGGDDRSSAWVPPLWPRRQPRRSHEERSNPRLYPANVASVSLVSRLQKQWRRLKSPAPPSIQALSGRVIRSGRRSRPGPFAWPPGPSCVTAPAAITSTMARQTNTVVRP